MKMIRKNLWIPSLISSIKSKLNKKFKPQDSHGNIKFSTTDYFLSGLHFSFKIQVIITIR